MRKPVILLTIVWSLFAWCASSQAQESIDFSLSTNPSTLEPATLADQLDTTNLFRHTVPLQVLTADFPESLQLSIETYYQKSTRHHLLEMSKAIMPVKRTFLVSEGLGTTYWKVSDGQCWVVLQHQTTQSAQDLEVMDRGCIQ